MLDGLSDCHGVVPLIRRALLSLAVCPFLLVAPAHANSVYKWVDENGVVHFTNVPKSRGQHAERVDIRPNLSNPDKPRKTAPAAATARSNAPSPRLCEKALHWTQNDLKVLRENASSNLSGGHIDAQRHASAQAALNTLEQRITHDNCLAARGQERSFYLCLSNGVGLMACSQALEEALAATESQTAVSAIP